MKKLVKKIGCKPGHVCEYPKTPCDFHTGATIAGWRCEYKTDSNECESPEAIATCEKTIPVAKWRRHIHALKANFKAVMRRLHVRIKNTERCGICKYSKLYVENRPQYKNLIEYECVIAEKNVARNMLCDCGKFKCVK